MNTNKGGELIHMETVIVRYDGPVPEIVPPYESANESKD